MNKDFTLNNCLFVSVKLTKNADPDKNKYGSYGVGFDSRSEFSLIVGSIGKKVIIFGVDLSSSLHIDNKNKGFTQPKKRFVLSQHYNGNNNILFVNAIKIYQIKAFIIYHLWNTWSPS